MIRQHQYLKKLLFLVSQDPTSGMAMGWVIQEVVVQKYNIPKLWSVSKCLDYLENSNSSILQSYIMFF